MAKIILDYVPEEDLINGLMVLFDEETEFETAKAFADIHARQQEYELPESDRKIIKAFAYKRADISQ